jgi:hypothetical protein
MIFELIYPTKETIQKNLELAVQKNITSAKIFDLRLAAVALSTQINYLITYNTKDFTEIDGLTALLPQEIFSLTSTMRQKAEGKTAMNAAFWLWRSVGLFLPPPTSYQ